MFKFLPIKFCYFWLLVTLWLVSWRMSLIDFFYQPLIWLPFVLFIQSRVTCICVCGYTILLLCGSKADGKNVTDVQGDVSNLADLDRLYATVKQQKGRIDILFANAGVVNWLHWGQLPKHSLTKHSASMFCRTLRRCLREKGDKDVRIMAIGLCLIYSISIHLPLFRFLHKPYQ